MAVVVNRRDVCHRHKKNTYVVESEIKLLDGETCLSKIIICHVCWSETNSKLFSQGPLCSWVVFSIGH